MSFKISQLNSFNKDLKRCHKRNYNIELLKIVITKLQQTGTLPIKYKSHKLKGNYRGRLECHIKPDWLLIWFHEEKNKTIILERTGTHSDLFQ